MRWAPFTPETVQKGVIDLKADIGIALDGDGDRVILIDENAQVLDGDKFDPCYLRTRFGSKG